MAKKSMNEIIKARTNMNRAINAHRQEGFKYTQPELTIFDKVVTGELTSDELRMIFQTELQKLKIKHPESFTEGNTNG